MYVDALHFRKDEIIRVIERINGKRIITEHKPDWHFYVNDPRGSHKSMFGDNLKKIQPSCYAERTKLINQFNGKKWESNINPVFRILEQHYRTAELPKLHVAFFDIETDFSHELGYAPADNPFNPVTSISIYLQWIDQMICLAVPPKTLTWAQAEEIASKVDDVILCRTEKEMLSSFLDLIEDADVLSGWNSEMYDIPYTVNRVTKVLGKSETRRFNVWPEYPKERIFDRGGKKMPTYDLFGRVHLDYLQLYKKYSYEERHSYALNNIAEAELGQQKVNYNGTLDELYNNDFEKFLRYNIQDTKLLDLLDKKLQYIDLCNSIAHANCVLLPTTMGSVAMIDQAITIEAHLRNVIVVDKKQFGVIDAKAAGGWVAKPRKGLHKWIGSSDLNSLYPSTIRALNMSPETIVAQVDLSETDQQIADWEAARAPNTFANWWNDRFCPIEMDNFFNNNNYNKLTLKFESGEEYIVTGAELRKLIFEGDGAWCISANGTIFRTDQEGIIPGLLARWYSERKQLQAVLKNYGNLDDNPTVEGFRIPPELFTSEDEDPNVHHASPYDYDNCFKPEKLSSLIETGNREQLIEYMNLHQLILSNGKAIYRDQSALKKIVQYWDKRQLVKKINLNSAYGALLNVGSRFFDQRIGQSTTLTGRNITRHMAAKTNEYISGVYDHYGECIIYGDTDSCYFSAYNTLKKEIESGDIDWSKENIIEIYDQIANDVSNTFPQFLKDEFNVPLTRSAIIKSSREVVAESGLFIKKKRYAALVYDQDGKRKDINGSSGKVKVTGLDLRRSDTPKFVQEFLLEILVDVLHGKSEEMILEKVKAFKQVFIAMKPWEKGSPKAVNNLTKYRDKEASTLLDKCAGKKIQFTMPGHVRASLNWNLMLEIHRDKQTPRIVDGQKVVVCKLKTNSTMMKSMAYPTDITHLPDWFLELPFDDDQMVMTIVDQKVENLLGVLNWDLAQTSAADSHFDNLFG